VLTLHDRALRAAADLVHALARQRRARLPAAELLLGLECGRSDPSSGLVANPLVGALVDRLVDAGGAAIFGETTEWIGAEAAARGQGRRPAVALTPARGSRGARGDGARAGIDLTWQQPVHHQYPGRALQHRGEVLGSHRQGRQPADPGCHRLWRGATGLGVWAMDAPAYAPESLTGFTIAGCSMALFTTGVGNSYVSALMPTLKITGNPATAGRVRQQIDLDASAVFTGAMTLEEAADRLDRTSSWRWPRVR
jgi:altronate dehydratase large subunit